ncbi:MAG: hypothetical protein GOV15_00465 [Candidatus Diapherotrites archaeon]|nr:hypothetical protein [Candidatus Diapherotrites archaeon]
MYSGGIDNNLPDDEKIKYQSKIHPFIKGGACTQLNNLNLDTLKDLLKSDVGFATTRNAIWKI